MSYLVVLCKVHHDQLHNENLNIVGYKDTLKGKILDYSVSSEKSNEKRAKKYNKENIELIKDISKKFNTDKHIIMELKNNYNISISNKTLSKILNNTY